MEFALPPVALTGLIFGSDFLEMTESREAVEIFPVCRLDETALKM
jgi:hypothetical protein